MAFLGRALGIVAGVLSVLFVIAALLAVGLAVGQRRAPGGLPQVGGYMVAAVMSGSMEPGIRTGDLILVQAVTGERAARLEPGQVITFRAPNDAPAGSPSSGAADTRAVWITHRIVGAFTITRQDGGERQLLYATKGDANDSVDRQLVSPAQIAGEYRMRVPLAGYLVVYARTPLGFLAMIVLPALWLVASEVRAIWRADGKQEGSAATQGGPAPEAGEKGGGAGG